VALRGPQPEPRHCRQGPAGPGNGSSDTTASQITQWVESHFTAETINGVTVYDPSGTET